MLLETVDFEVIVDDFEQDDIMCNSVLHMVEWKMPAHRAHWFASAPCTHLLIVCEERRRLCLRHGSWKCNECSATVAYEDIEWTAVE